MNSSGSRIIHTVIVLCLPFPSIWSVSFVSKIEGRICFKSESCIGERGHHLGCYQQLFRLTNGKPCRCYYTCGHMIFMTWVISRNNLIISICTCSHLFSFKIRAYPLTNSKVRKRHLPTILFTLQKYRERLIVLIWAESGPNNNDFLLLITSMHPCTSKLIFMVVNYQQHILHAFASLLVSLLVDLPKHYPSTSWSFILGLVCSLNIVKYLFNYIDPPFPLLSHNWNANTMKLCVSTLLQFYRSQ